MKVGIVGSPQSGKTTLFRLLTGMVNLKRRGGKQGIGVMEVPDQRVRILSDVYKPRKTTYVKIDLYDTQTYSGQEFLNTVRDFDLLIVVMGSFMGESGVTDSIDFLDNMAAEFYLADLVSIESRLERLSAGKVKPVNDMEIPFLKKCKQSLDAEILLRNVDFPSYEQDFLSTFAFYSNKPMILAPNILEKHVGSNYYPGLDRIEQLSKKSGYKIVEFSGEVEEEIETLEPESRMEFLRAYGISQPGTARIAQTAYASLGLVSFFTIGSDEVRAWTIKQGTSVKEAAGKIHSDLERGFIRADVVSFDDFAELGSVQACKINGLSRLEGKDYVVQDGDVVDVRFNV